MAKRYHQSPRDRMDESRGEERHVMHDRERARRHSDMYEDGMIHEDHSQVANMPQEVMMKPWHRERYAGPEHLDDTIRGIDHQIMEDEKHEKKSSMDGMY